jgi:hypothetical protein
MLIVYRILQGIASILLIYNSTQADTYLIKTWLQNKTDKNMTSKQNKNKWYVYQADVYGVDGMLDFSSKESLIKFMVSDEFLERCMPDGVSENTADEVKKISNRFALNEIDFIKYSEALLNVFKRNEGEIDTMYIEDFESLCKGKSKFGKMALEIFFETNELDPLENIPNKLMEDFKDFLDNANENWTG